MLPVTEIRNPNRDDLGESPIDWQDIPLGPGQEGNNNPHLQWTKQGDPLRNTDVRRAPGYETHIVVHRPPQAPA